MMIDLGSFELYGHTPRLALEKIETNVVRVFFESMAREWRGKVYNDFNKIFSSLDELYQNADVLANEVRLKSIEEAMKILVAHEVYDVSEQQFYEEFVQPYETWVEDFDVIAGQYEAIVERTAELDAYRTSRRLNRRKWVGYGSKQAVYSADADNFISNLNP